ARHRQTGHRPYALPWIPSSSETAAAASRAGRKWAYTPRVIDGLAWPSRPASPNRTSPLRIALDPFLERDGRRRITSGQEVGVHAQGHRRVGVAESSR